MDPKVKWYICDERDGQRDPEPNIFAPDTPLKIVCAYPAIILARRLIKYLYPRRPEGPTGVGVAKCLSRFMTFPRIIMRVMKRHIAAISICVIQIGIDLISFPSHTPRKVYTAIIL